MKKKKLIDKIIQGAKRDEQLRLDPRYLETMGFLTAKGFLKTNQNIAPRPNKRIAINEAIWAGMNVEPRILEVLPAAILRLPRHFDLDAAKHSELFATIDRFKRGEENGERLWGIPYEKLKVWLDLPLNDARIKSFQEKKITRTYRLAPNVLEKLKRLATQWGCAETEALERSILR